MATILDQLLGMLGGSSAMAPSGGGMQALQAQPAGNLMQTLPFRSADRDALMKMPEDQLVSRAPYSGGAGQTNPSGLLQLLGLGGAAPQPQPGNMLASAGTPPAPSSNLLEGALNSFGGAPADALRGIFDYRDKLASNALNTPDQANTLPPDAAPEVLDQIDVTGRSPQGSPPPRQASGHSPLSGYGEPPESPEAAQIRAMTVPVPPSRPTVMGSEDPMPVGLSRSAARPNGAAVMAGFGSDSSVPVNALPGYSPSNLPPALQGKAVNEGRPLQATPAEKAGGLFSPDMAEWIRNVGFGLASGRNLSEGIRNAALLNYDASTKRTEKQQTNQTRELAVRKYGFDPQVVANMDGKTLANALIQVQAEERKRATPEYDYREVNGVLGRFNKNDPRGSFQPVEGAPAKRNVAPITAEQRQFWGIPADDTRPYAIDENGKPMLIGGSGTTVNIGDSENGKVPSGYRWADPNNKDAGVVPIPGGPATQLPAETAARFGLANKYLNSLQDGEGGKPGLLSRLRKGGATGANYPLGQMFSATDSADIMRQQQEGADAVQRFLTGAGMNESESKAYAARYSITPTDTAESAVRKAEQLGEALKAMKNAALRGRGSEENTPITPDTSAPGGNGGTTSSGLKWKVR